MGSPYINRFLQPDTLIPGVDSPQSWNRYSYVYNNPIIHNDPTGNSADCPQSSSTCNDGPSTNISPEEILKKYNVTITGNWTDDDKWAVVHGVLSVAYRFARQRNKNESGAEAFRNTYDTATTPLVFLGGNSSSDHEYFISSECGPITGGGCTTGKTQDVNGNTVMLINFMSMCCYPASQRNNVVHELGHLFNVNHGGYPASLAGNYAANRSSILRPFDGTQWQLDAFYDPQSPGRSNSEMFGDMFVAWIFDAWNTDPLNASKVEKARSDLNTNMAEWLK